MSDSRQFLEIPKIFRVLVIDDQICNDAVCNEKAETDSANVKLLVRRYIEYVVKCIVNEQRSSWTIPIEVDFAKDPDEGVERWMESVYDLTLVDSDFSRDETMRGKIDEKHKRNFLDLDLEFAGAYLYRFLHEMLYESTQFKDSRQGCCIALWTGLGLGGKDKNDRAERLLRILPREDGERHLYFIPKREDDIRLWQNLNLKGGEDLKEGETYTIETIIQSMVGFNPILNPRIEVNTEAIIGRIKGLYRIKSPEDFSRLSGIDGCLYTGCVKAENGKVLLLDSWITGGRLLSPLLRRNEDIDDCVETNDDSEEVKKRKRENKKKLKDLTISLPEMRRNEEGILVPSLEQDGQHGVERIIAAATPLTGCSAVGSDYAIDLMIKKIKALLDGPFDKVVLKTVYLDSMCQWDDLNWPELQAQSHHRTRCIRSISHPRTLWNTGKTALESFTPKMMHQFLDSFLKYNGDRARVIVSLGSKYPQWNLCGKAYRTREKINEFEKFSNELEVDLKEVWGKLFNDVFLGIADKKEDSYPIVEINVRHYLRECIAFHLGGHEYLSPSKIDPDKTEKETEFTQRYDTLDLEFGIWLSVLDDVANNNNKKLLLKLPFRGDILHFIRLIRDYVRRRREGKTQTNILGITLINAFKSGVPAPKVAATFSPAWYGMFDVGGKDDKRWGMQMSGESLKASRYEVIGEVSKLTKDGDTGLEIHISGGVMDFSDITYCIQNLKCSAVQIGTWALMDLNLTNQAWAECSSIPPAIGVGKPKIRNCPGKCHPCRVVCPYDAFTQGTDGKSASIDSSKCRTCKQCATMCNGRGKFGVVLDNGVADREVVAATDNCPKLINPRIAFCLHELCNGCGKCSRTFYCDTFMNRCGLDLPPMMDSRNCTGCGLCAQTCPRGAIQLFDPKHILVLIGEDNEKDNDGEGVLSVWQRRLMAYEIPHLVFRIKDVVRIYSKWLNASGDDREPQIKRIWDYRKEHDIFFDKMSGDAMYVDERVWEDFAKVLKKVSDGCILQKWLFLAWSDPGQVLKNSPVICAIDKDKCNYFDNSLSKPDCELQLKEVLSRPGVREIRTEVTKRLNNLREVR